MWSAGVILSLAATASAQTVTGTATYRERIALPADAILEATLEDVTRPQNLGFARLEKPGLPPFSFSIVFDANRIDPAHQYIVRARITQAGRLLFVTDEPARVLTNGAGTSVSMMLRMVQGAAATVFEETVWILTHLGADPVPALSGDRIASLQFSKANLQVTGFGGCNRLSGRYMVSGDRLTLTPLTRTMMACIDGMDLETRFLDAVSQKTTFRIEGAQMEFFDFTGRPVARFRAKS